MRICVLASGSGGNCLWVEAGQTRALFDAGLPLRETRRRCLDAGLPFRELTDVFLTHEHADHSHAAGILGRRMGVRVHATRGTFKALRDPPPPELRFPLAGGQDVELRGLKVTPIAQPHDAVEPVSYVFDDGSVRGALVTDLGSAPRSVVRALQGLDALVLEFNHDLPMLLNGPYPWSLKKRISSDLGHLSNEQSARLLAQIVHGRLRHVTLAHLSEHNNTPSHARRSAESVLSKFGSRAKVTVGSQSRPLDPMVIEPERAEPLRRARQLALFA